MRFRIALAASLASALIVSSCGFHPLYGNAGAGGGPAGRLANIYVESIPERVGYELRNDLIDMFDTNGDATNSDYRLQLVLREVREPVGFRRDATITRFNYRLFARYELIERSSTRAVKSGEVRSITAYNVAQSPYATVAGEKDAQDRAARDVAERIRTEIAVYFHNAPQTAQASAAASQPPQNP